MLALRLHPTHPHYTKHILKMDRRTFNCLLFFLNCYSTYSSLKNILSLFLKVYIAEVVYFCFTTLFFKVNRRLLKALSQNSSTKFPQRPLLSLCCLWPLKNHRWRRPSPAETWAFQKEAHIEEPRESWSRALPDDRNTFVWLSPSYCFKTRWINSV